MSETRVPSIGTLTDRIQLLRKMSTSEPAGGEVAVYSPIATVWARVRQLSVRQAFATDARGQTVSHAVVLRFRTDLKAGDRVIYRGRNLEIEGVADLNGRRAYVSLQCAERVVTG